MDPIISFNSIVLHSNYFIRTVERLGSLAGHTYKVLKKEDSSSTTWVAIDQLPSKWQKLAVVIQLTIALPLTLIAIVIKAIWRFRQDIQIKQQSTISDEKNVNCPELPTKRVSTEENIELGPRENQPEAPKVETPKVEAHTEGDNEKQPVDEAEKHTPHQKALSTSTPIVEEPNLVLDPYLRRTTSAPAIFQGIHPSTNSASSSSTQVKSERHQKSDQAAVNSQIDVNPLHENSAAEGLAGPSKPLFLRGGIHLGSQVSKVKNARATVELDELNLDILFNENSVHLPLVQNENQDNSQTDERALVTTNNQAAQRAFVLPSFDLVLAGLKKPTSTSLVITSPGFQSRTLRVQRFQVAQDVQLLVESRRRQFGIIPASLLLKEFQLCAHYNGLPTLEESTRIVTQTPARNLVAYGAIQRLKSHKQAQKTIWDTSSYANRATTLLAAPLQEAPFTEQLRNEANLDVFNGEGDYLENLKHLRIRLTNPSQQDISQARAIYLRSMVDTASGIIETLLGKPKEASFSKQLENDFHAIKHLDPSNRVGKGLKLARQLGAKLNFFDPHASGNHPYYVGTREVSGKVVQILRHPVPTVETRDMALQAIVDIAPEYKGFIQSCEDNGEAVLYNCLLKPKADEAIRIEKLLELNESYPSTFHFVRFPLDGHLEHVDKFSSLDEYAQAIAASLKQAVQARGKNRMSGDFIFSESVRNVAEKYSLQILEWAHTQIDSSPLNETDKKRALLCLFTSVFKDKILQELKIDFYNNSCKDAIDRGAVHLISDLSWHSFLTGKFDEYAPTIREQAHWPAFMAKTQKILSDRSEFILSFVRWLESVQSKESSIRESYEEKLELNLGELEFARQKASETITTETAIDFYKNQLIEYRFNTKLYPFSKKEQVLKQFMRDKIGASWDPNVEKLLKRFEREGNVALKNVLMQLLSQSILPYALESLMKTYQPLAIRAINEKYTVVAQYDEATETLRVQHKEMKFMVRNEDATSPLCGQVQAYITVNINFEVDSRRADASLSFSGGDITLNGEMSSILRSQPSSTYQAGLESGFLII